VEWPHASHDRQCPPVEMAREIGTHAAPVIAAIVRSIKILTAPVQPRVRVGTDDVRRVPVRPIGIAAAAAARPAGASASTRRLRRRRRGLYAFGIRLIAAELRRDGRFLRLVLLLRPGLAIAHTSRADAL